MSSDYNALQSCVGLNCTGTVKSVNGINPNTSGEVCIDEVCYANYANCTNYAYALYFASNSTGDRTTCARFCMKYTDVEKCPILALCSSGGSDYYISPATNYIKDITITDRKVSFTKGDDTQCCFEFGNVTGIGAILFSNAAADATARVGIICWINTACSLCGDPPYMCRWGCSTGYDTMLAVTTGANYTCSILATYANQMNTFGVLVPKTICIC